jgi:tripartite-type tricarboxylate transporter receptor subunit TctC
MRHLTGATTTRRRGLIAAVALAAVGFLASGPAPAQEAAYPTRPVTLLVPFPAGGSTDVVARVVAAKLGEILGQQVVVENRGGAGGNIGAAAVARAEPDGYTLLMGTISTHAINPALYPRMPYDPVESFAPVSLLVVVPNVLVVHPSLEAETVQELVALLKAEPGQHNYASSGNGTPLHLSGELFKTMAGVEMTHVPYRGSGPALNDLLGGQVRIMFDNLPSSIGHIRQGALRALAVTTAQRSPAAPDLPTMAEAGLPGYETYTWNALFAPAGTPQPVVDRLAQAAAQAVADPAVKERLADLSAVAVGAGPAELREHVKAELAKWGPIVKASGATAAD